MENTPTDAPARLVVLVSGSGSNFQAIANAIGDGALNASVAAVISDNGHARALERATALNIETETVEFGRFDERREFDASLRECVQRYAPDLVVLAGYMRILDDAFVEQWQGKLINIHPSLLPAYRGLHTHRRVLMDGTAEHGATVHFVVPELDAGQIIIQAKLTVQPEDDEAALSARVLRMEHVIYPIAVQWFVEGRLSIVGSEVLLDGAVSARQRVTESDIFK